MAELRAECIHFALHYIQYRYVTGCIIIAEMCKSVFWDLDYPIDTFLGSKFIHDYSANVYPSDLYWSEHKRFKFACVMRMCNILLSVVKDYTIYI